MGKQTRFCTSRVSGRQGCLSEARARLRQLDDRIAFLAAAQSLLLALSWPIAGLAVVTRHLRSRLTSRLLRYKLRSFHLVRNTRSLEMALHVWLSY